MCLLEFHHISLAVTGVQCVHLKYEKALSRRIPFLVIEMCWGGGSLFLERQDSVLHHDIHKEPSPKLVAI